MKLRLKMDESTLRRRCIEGVTFLKGQEKEVDDDFPYRKYRLYLEKLEDSDFEEVTEIEEQEEIEEVETDEQEQFVDNEEQEIDDEDSDDIEDEELAEDEIDIDSLTKNDLIKLILKAIPDSYTKSELNGLKKEVLKLTFLKHFDE